MRRAPAAHRRIPSFGNREVCHRGRKSQREAPPVFPSHEGKGRTRAGPDEDQAAKGGRKRAATSRLAESHGTRLRPRIEAVRQNAQRRNRLLRWLFARCLKKHFCFRLDRRPPRRNRFNLCSTMRLPVYWRVSRWARSRVYGRPSFCVSLNTRDVLGFATKGGHCAQRG
jgi:hypothetical protein